MTQDAKEVAGGHVRCERAVLKRSAQGLQSPVQSLEPVNCAASALSSSLCALVTSHWIMMSQVKFTDPFWSLWTETFL